MRSDEDPGSGREEAAYAARLSDGRTAAALDVEVRFGTEGIEILRPGNVPRVWPYSSLSAADPLTAHAIDALLSSSDELGATLFVPSTEFARHLPTRAHQVSARSARWRAARAWIAAGAAVVAGIVALYLLDISPARVVASAIPDATRKKMGEGVVRQLVEDRAVCNAPAGRAALDTLTQRLMAGRPEQRFEVVVVDWKLVNAFAAPGEKIVIARGVLDGAETPDEVAGVLAHEMGHGLERHPETGFVRAIGLAAGAELVLGGSSGGLAGLSVFLVQLSYTRAAEHEADVRALALLRDASISPKGLASFFDRVGKTEGETEDASASFNALSILRSHPLTAERRKLVESAPDYPATPSLSDSQWQALKAICSTP